MRQGAHPGPVFVSFASFAVEIMVSIVYLRLHRFTAPRDGSEVRSNAMVWGRWQIHWVFPARRFQRARGDPVVKKETVPARLSPVASPNVGGVERSLS